MIYGIGTDIVQVVRIRESLDRHGERFAERILSDAELAEFRASAHPARFLARRFAAKEAVAKAFGTGFSGGLTFRDITIGHDDAGNACRGKHCQCPDAAGLPSRPDASAGCTRPADTRRDC